MTVLHWSESASAELRAAYDYIAKDNPMVALKVVNRIVAASELVARRNIGRVGRRRGTFEKSVIGAPYVLIYTRDDVSPVTIIITLMQTARHWPAEYDVD